MTIVVYGERGPISHSRKCKYTVTFQRRLGKPNKIPNKAPQHSQDLVTYYVGLRTMI